MFIAQLIIFTFTFILHILRKIPKFNAFFESSRIKDKISFVYIINAIMSFFIVAIFLIAPLGILFDYITKDRHLNPKNNHVVYTLGHLEDVDFKSSRSSSYYRGTFRFQIGTKFYTMKDKMPDEYRDYIYIIKVNLEKPEYVDTIPILIKDIPQNTVFYMQNIYQPNAHIAYPINTNTIKGNLHTIKTNNIISFELKSDNLNLIRLPLAGWSELPVIATGNEQTKARNIEWFIRFLSLLTSVYSIYLFFTNIFSTSTDKKRNKSKEERSAL